MGKATTVHLLAEDELATVAEIAPIGIFRTDRNGNCTYVNDCWCQLAGWSRREALGSGWTNALHPDDRSVVCEEWQAVVKAGAEFNASFRFQHRGGGVRAISAHAIPVVSENGEFGGHLGTLTDVTHRRELERKLHTLSHRLSERAKEFNCLIGISHVVERAGDSLEAILRDTTNLLPSAWEHSDVACARIVLEQTEYTSVNFVVTQWKQSVDILVRGDVAGVVEVYYREERSPRDEGPFSAEERNLINAIAERLGHLVERFTTQQLLRDQEAELRGRLTHLSRVSTLGEMASNIAHEVNQPLTAVATYAQACIRFVEAGMIEGPRILDVLNRISKEALRAGEIVHRLQNMVQRRVSKRVECHMNELIRDLEPLAAVDARLCNVGLRLETATSLPPILADRVQIQQVVLNLIRNGIDAVESAEGGEKEVIVRTSIRDDGEVEVTVIDTGCGLTSDAAEKMFEPFFSTKPHGLGMGLSISRSIILSHGGRLQFSQNDSGGMTFSFTTPVLQSNHNET